MADLEKTKQLLKDVNRIVKHHKEIAKIKGEDFNIFKILRVQTKEVKTHSRFLAELFNPKGSHHLGSIFLELFLKKINSLENKIQVNANNETEVYVEHHISKVDFKASQGGNIDILIKDKESNTISIENKIYAGDQEQQVLRYVNYNKDKNTVYYLTLFGNEPNDKSITDANGNKLKSGEDYRIISYKDHILPWLELCLKEAAEKPILRESIKQYIILIKKLTYTLNMAENEEINKILIKNLEPTFHIVNNLESVKNILLQKFETQIKEIAKELNMLSNDRLSITPSNWKHHTICFSEEEGGILIGIKRDKTDKSKPELLEIKALFSDRYRTTILWPMYRLFYSNINSNSKFWVDVENGNAKKKALKFIRIINDNFNTNKY